MFGRKKVKCRYCGTEVKVGVRHQCAAMRRAHQPERIVSEDDGDFFVSLAVAAATNDWMLGAAVGGDVAGAMLGDIARDGELGDGVSRDYSDEYGGADDSERRNSSPPPERSYESPSYGGGGYDPGGDSGSYGGGSDFGGGSDD